MGFKYNVVYQDQMHDIRVLFLNITRKFPKFPAGMTDPHSSFEVNELRLNTQTHSFISYTYVSVHLSFFS